MPSRKGVKIPSRLPLIIPDNRHYLEFPVLKVGKQRVAGLVFRAWCVGNNYQRETSRRSAAFAGQPGILEFPNGLRRGDSGWL